MKLLKTVPAVVMLAGGVLASLNAAADDTVFTVMDDPSTAQKPFEGNLNAGYLAQSGNTKSSSLTADTTLTWYGNTTAWSLWGNASNTSSNDERSSEKYAVGGRSRYNMTDADYLFGQASWLTDRYNGYRQRDIATAGYGRQFLNGPVHSLRFEFGPGVRYDEYTDGETERGKNLRRAICEKLKIYYICLSVDCPVLEIYSKSRTRSIRTRVSLLRIAAEMGSISSVSAGSMPICSGRYFASTAL